jgi:hypothetical protein
MCRLLHLIAAAALFFGALPAFPQNGKMSDEQQAWFLCLISKEWCVAPSVNQAGARKAVAMVAAKNPLRLHSGISRATLQIGCSDGNPVIMLHSGREISGPTISLHYTMQPSGRSGDVNATNVEAGHFFEFQRQEFLKDLEGATTAYIQVKLTTGESGEVEFNVVGSEKTLEKLDCASLQK